MNDLIALAKDMRSLQTRKAFLEEELKKVTAQLDIVRLCKIPDTMAEMGVRSIVLDGIGKDDANGRIQLANDCHASIVAEKKGEAYTWIDDNGFGSLIIPYIQPSTLKAFMKEQVGKGQEFPDDLFKYQPFLRASIVTV